MPEQDNPTPEQKRQTIKFLESASIKLIAAHWQLFAKAADISDLESEGVIFEAVIPFIIFGLMCICRRRRIDFDLLLKEAREYDDLMKLEIKQSVH